MKHHFYDFGHPNVDKAHIVTGIFPSMPNVTAHGLNNMAQETDAAVLTPQTLQTLLHRAEMLC